MASQFQQESLKIVVAQVCQTIGFQGINSTPLNVIIDLLHRYIKEIAITTHHYAEHGGRTTPNLDDLSLTFREMGISLSELEEYVSCVEPTPFPYDVPKVPVPRHSNLNFLKPGAREILSRPLYVHEHLPPMYPEKEDEEDVAAMNSHSNNLERDSDNGLEEKSQSSSQMKRSLSEGETSPNKKIKYTNEEEGEPVREIDSVMMTTSGFISSAREGKLPEAKRPNIPMVQQRSSSPVSSKAPSHNKKRSTMEKIIRHKNHQGGIMPGPLANPKSKEFKFKPKPKIPSAPPGTGSLQCSRPGGIPPKLKIPVPKIPIPKISTPSAVIGENVNSSIMEVSEKKKRRDKERRKERSKEGKKDKKEDRPKKDKNRDDKKKRDKAHHNKMRNERTRIRMKGLTKEEELKRYKERENELIAALAASSAVTVTSIPPPSLRVREISQEKSPEKVLTSPPDGKSKLSIFKKVSKSKDGDKYRSRENSPVLMIDDIVKEEPKSPPPSPSVDYGTFHEEHAVNSPPGTPSTPKTPDILPVIKNKRGRPHKIKIEEGINISPSKKYSKAKNSSPRGRKRGGGIFSPSWRHPMGDMTPDRPSMNPMMLDRPKTPEGLSQEDLSSPSFSIPSFPSAPGFIPPFSRFPFGPFGSPPAIPPVLPSISDRSRLFMSTSSEHTRADIDDNRPQTPTHEEILSIPLHVSNRSDQFLHDGLPTLPETPNLLIKEAYPRQASKPEKPSKLDKEKKKEHKKEKKEKEKLRKKKEKKEKEKAREEKKREKERLKQERKEKKKRGRKRSDPGIKDTGVPKITLKFPSEGGSALTPLQTPEHKSTPKLVIKPVVKHPYEENKLLLSVEGKKRLPSASPPASSLPRMSSIKLPPEDEPGSPPEVAKFSPLITRPPKVKSIKKNSSEQLTVPPLKIKDPSSLKISKHDSNSSKNLKDSHKDPYKEHKDSYKDHKDPYKDYKETHKEYREPNKEYREPHKEYKDIHKDQKEAHKEYKDTHKDYKEPPKDFKEPHKDIKEHKDLCLNQLSATVPPLKIRNAPPLKIRNAPPLKIRNASPLKIRNAPPLKVYEETKPPNSKKSEKKDKKKKSPVFGVSPLQDNTTIKITTVLPPQEPPTSNVVPEQPPPALSPTPKGSRKSIIIVPSSSSVTPSTSQPSVVPPSSKTTATGLVTETVGPIGHFVDDQGNEVWICPTCGKQDDGSPMIGCDTCDDWYHWLCVGIHVPPSERENWYCPRCLSQHKQKGLGNIERKKRGRKRKFPVPS